MEPQVAVQAKAPGLGVAGFVCGLLATVLAFVPFINLAFTPVLGIIAIVFGAVAISQASKRGAPKGLSIAGLVLGAVGLLIMVASFAAAFA